MKRMLRGMGWVAVALSLSTVVRADDATWALDANGNWNANGNWTPNTGYPNGIDAVAALTNNITATRTNTLAAAITVGTLYIGDNTGTSAFRLQNGTGGSLTLDVTTGDARIIKNSGGGDNIAATLNLSDPLVVSNRTNQGLTLSGIINGSLGITFDGPGGSAIGQFVLSGNNTGYSGNSMIQNSRVQLANANAFGTGAIAVTNGGQLWINTAYATNETTISGNGWTESVGQIGAIRINTIHNGVVKLADNSRIGVWNANETGILNKDVTGAGFALEKSGLGVLVLNGSGDLGAITATGGVLIVNGVQAGGLTTIKNNAAVGGSGSLGSLTLESGSRLSPGSPSSPAALTVSNDLDMTAVTMTNYLGGPVNSLVDVKGNVTVGGNHSVVLVPQGSLGPSYNLITYGGSLATNGATSFSLANAADFRQTFAFDDTAAGAVKLNVSGSAATLVWAGGVDNVWNLNTTANWTNSGTLLADNFLQADTVLFDDTTVQTNVSLTGTLSPAMVVVDSTNIYSFIGGGVLAGGSVVKLGTGTLTITNGHTFGGAVLISNGVLKANNNAALGSTNGATYVAAGGTLDVMGRNLGREVLNVEGTGYNGQGAIMNSGGAQNNATYYVNLTGDTLFNPIGRFDTRGANATDLGYVNGPGYNLTKIGNGQYSVVNATMNVGNIVVSNGNFQFESATTVNPDASIAIVPGASMGFWNLAAPFGRPVFIEDGFINAGSGNSSQNHLTNTITVVNSMTNSGGAAITYDGVIAGDAYFVQAGGGTAILNANNTYTGITYVAGNGVLIAANPGALSDTAAGTIVVGGNTTTGRSLGLASNVTITGETLTLQGNSAGRAYLRNSSADTNTWAGPIELQGDVNPVGVIADTGLLRITGDMTGAATNGAFLFIRGGTGGAGEFLGSLVITGNVSKTDDGGWLLGSVGETYDWSQLTIARGQLKMGAADVMPANRLLLMGEGGNNTAVFELNGFNQTIAGLQTNGGVSGSATVRNTGGAPATLTISNDANYVFNKTITDGGVGSELNLVKDGTGIQVLSGATTFRGTTTVKGGQLILATGNALLLSTASNWVPGGLVFSNATAFAFGALAGDSDLTLENTAAAGVTLTVGSNNTSTTYGGVLSGAGGLSKVGNGLLILTNAQTYAGTTLVRGGNGSGLRLTETASLGNGPISVDGNLQYGAALELEGDHALANAFTLTSRQQGTINSAHVRNLSGTNVLSGTVTLGTGGSTYNYESVSGLLEISGQLNGQATGTRTLQLMGAGDGLLSGVYNGNANATAELNKRGAGTWTLTASNDYKGTTRILEGTLALSGSGSIVASTNINVSLGAVFDVTAVSGGFSLASNQTLSGLGTVNGGMSLSEGSVLSPGASPGLITLNGDLNAQTGSTMVFELASTNDYDQVVGLVNLTLAGTIDVALFGGFDPAAGDVFDLLDWSGILTDGGYTLNTPALSGSLVWDTTNFETDGSLAVIPEPATVGLVGLLGVALLVRTRRRRQ